MLSLWYLPSLTLPKVVECLTRVQDKYGYITFHDRLGDTYRAKGHNISTFEVETAIVSHPAISSANVYAIPMNQYGYEGQLGCAAITFQNSDSISPENNRILEAETLKELESHLVTKAGLPGYGVPRFVRIIVDLGEEADASRNQLGIAERESVGTEYVSLMMKKLKTGLRNEGLYIGTPSRLRYNQTLTLTTRLHYTPR
jgi:acyl-CoA synthetase (AMP-forming)/AMP-acid ligase II